MAGVGGRIQDIPPEVGRIVANAAFEEVSHGGESVEISYLQI